MLQTTKQGDALTVYLTGEIDHCVAEGLRNEIEMLIVAHDPHRLILRFFSGQLYGQFRYRHDYWSI